MSTTTTKGQSFIQRAWYANEASWSYLLKPLSWGYGVLSNIHKKNALTKPRVNFDVPVVVVGNITAGGTGKTPLVCTLIEALRARGYTPGVVSRGYKAKYSTSEPYIVTPKNKANEVGDEPLLISLTTQTPVVICEDRVKAVQCLLEEYPVVDIVLSDDGLQHYALKRDIEIAVVDGERRFGNGMLLPAGPLRETPERLKQVDYVIVNGKNAQPGEISMQGVLGPKLFALKSEIVKPIADFNGPVHAVAGIGNPQRFFNSLREQGLDIIEHAFPDHYQYKASDFDFEDEYPIIMTQKDATKCFKLPIDNCWVTAYWVTLPESFISNLVERIQNG